MQTGTTVREATFDLLRSLGITTIFGNPGSTEIPMFRDFPEDFRYILGLQESVVAAMADGYAQATRNAAMINLHSAAGLGHALGNIFTAFRNETPLIVTAGQQARSILPFEPFLFAENATEFPKPYVKWSCEPARAEDVPAALARAYYVAMQPPRGPVFVSIPVDDWDRQATRIEPRRVSRVIEGDELMLAELAEALARARQPAFVLGPGVARDEAWDAVIALAERHQAAVWAAPMSGRNSFPEDHRLFAGFLTPIRSEIVQKLETYDLVLVLGGALSIYHTEGEGPHVPPNTSVYQLVDNPSLAAWAPIGTSVVTSIDRGVMRLLRGPAPAARKAPAPRKPPPALDGSVFTDAYVLQQIAKLRPEDAIVIKEAPTSGAPLQQYLPILDKDGFYACASGGLGFGLPASIGIALGQPHRKTISFLGDGSAMYAIQGLWSAAQLGLPISFIIANNRRYEAILRFGRLFNVAEPVGTRLPNIDFATTARGQGIAATRVEDASTLDAALAQSFAADHPTLVEVLVD